MASTPYIGCNVLGFALGMDKEKMKMVFTSAGLPIGPYLVYRRYQWERDSSGSLDRAGNRTPSRPTAQSYQPLTNFHGTLRASSKLASLIETDELQNVAQSII